MTWKSKQPLVRSFGETCMYVGVHAAACARMVLAQRSAYIPPAAVRPRTVVTCATAIATMRTVLPRALKPPRPYPDLVGGGSPVHALSDVQVGGVVDVIIEVGALLSSPA